MYRTGDPRFRRRLNEIGHTLESANESAQFTLFEFGQTYVKPCLESFTDCFRTCIDASCPMLNLNAAQRDRIRRQRGRSRGRAELAFDFYDDWDEDENDALMGWAGNDEFDRLLSGDVGYGTLSQAQQVQHQQPGRQRGMSYPKGRRRSTVDSLAPDPTVIPGSSNFFAKLFGGKAKYLRYKPSAADLQENPGAKRMGRDITEGEALLREGGEGRGKKHRRARSGTVASGHTTDSLSSRGDIFPSDEELDDAVPLDDEFAMVLERRTTQSGGASGPDTETSSGRTRNSNERRRGKRPSAGSRTSTRSSRSRRRRSRTNSSAAQTPIDEIPPEHFDEEEEVPTMSELKQEETRLEREEEEDVERRRQEAQKLATERGLVTDETASKEATPGQIQSPVLQPVERGDEPSQLPTPLGTDDEREHDPSRPTSDSRPSEGDGAKS